MDGPGRIYVGGATLLASREGESLVATYQIHAFGRVLIPIQSQHTTQLSDRWTTRNMRLIYLGNHRVILFLEAYLVYSMLSDLYLTVSLDIVLELQALHPM